MTEIDEIYNFYINTANQDRDDKNYSFNYRLGANIHLDKSLQAYFKLVNFSMMNSMLNISTFHKNNQFQIIYNSITTTYTIPDGNYTATTLRDKINTLTLTTPFALNYDSTTHKYFWANTDSGTFKPLNMKSIMGFTSDSVALVGNVDKYGDNFINLLSYTKIILTTNNLLFEPTTDNNLLREYTANESINEIIAWIDKDIPTFATIKYDNYLNIETKLANRNISYINFNIMNEYKELIKDCPNWFIQFQIIVKKK